MSGDEGFAAEAVLAPIGVGALAATGASCGWIAAAAAAAVIVGGLLVRFAARRRRVVHADEEV
jgi:hypothetical protein